MRGADNTAAFVRRWNAGLAVGVLVAAAGIAAASPAAAADVVVFADADLQKAVNAQRGQPATTAVTLAYAASVTSLWAPAAQIDALGGIEAFTGLEDLYLDQNRISDVSALAGLHALEALYLDGNRIADIRPLGALTNLTYLTVSAQAISLGAILTTQTQVNPLYGLSGARIAPYSDTATVAGDGASWRLTTAGTHTLGWSWDGDLGGGSWGWFDGTITQKASATGQIEVTGTPTISGSVRTGGLVTAAEGEWDQGVVFAYQWLDDGVEIPGATQRSVTLGTAQEGGRISVQVTGSKPGFTSVTNTSAQTERVLLASTPTVSGKVAKGQKLTAKPGAWTAGTAFTYQWYGDRRAIPGATASTFTVTPSQQGMKILVKVTAKKAGYATVSVNSPETNEMRLLDTGSKASMAAAYKNYLVPWLRISTGWTGKTSSCTLGSESASSKLATIYAVNFYRAMNQLDGVLHSSTWSTQALRNSLMMQARGQITHYPSSSGRCWSPSGAEAAQTSNLALSSGSSSSVNGATGARAVSGYMTDPGPSNYFAGHRRWILYPTTTVMGTGSTTFANTLKVMGTSTSSTMAQPTWMEWPSAGYFPKQLEPQGLWSLSASSPTVDFSAAKVTVVGASSGKAFKVSKYPVLDGYGPNTITWRVSGLSLPKGKTVSSYKVTVSGIKGAAVTSYTYTVRIFDPYG